MRAPASSTVPLIGRREDLPPAAVIVWGPHLAYGVATGAAPAASAAIGLAGREPDEIGSAYTGDFRTVAIRYPRSRGWAGLGAFARLTLSLAAVGVLAAALLTARHHGVRLTAATAPFDVAASVAGLALLAVASSALLATILKSLVDLLPVTITGQVLRRTEIRARSRRRAPAYLMIIDDGRNRKLRPWLAGHLTHLSYAPPHPDPSRLAAHQWLAPKSGLTYRSTPRDWYVSGLTAIGRPGGGTRRSPTPTGRPWGRTRGWVGLCG